MDVRDILIFMCIGLRGVVEVRGHGYLSEPPGRSSMWLFGFNTPPNYQHNELFCGGFPIQWFVNGGKCGVCGDPYDGVRENEPPSGKYATGTITRTFTQGQNLSVMVQITASHKGYFEFRLCPSNDPSVTVTQTCLDRYLLTEAVTGGTKVYVDDSSVGRYNFDLSLPKNVSCENCVLQWRYRTGNRWGCYNNDYERGPCGLGWGPQEEFYACSDIRISSSADPMAVTTDSSLSTTATTTSPTTTATSTTTQRTTATQTTSTRPTTSAPTTTSQPSTTSTFSATTMQPTTTRTTTTTSQTTTTSKATTITRTTTPRPTTTTSPTSKPTTLLPSTLEPIPEPKTVCKGAGAWKGSVAMDGWCELNCNAPTPYCPPSHCACGREDQLNLDSGLLGTGKDCVSVTRDPGWDMWCRHNCPLGLCYLGTMCTCSDMNDDRKLESIYGPKL